MLEKNKILIWLSYFESRLPRRLGRKVPKRIAITKPTINEVLQVCQELNLECEADPIKKYPRTWHIQDLQGVIYVKTKIRKPILIKKIAMKILKNRTKKRKEQ